MVLLRKLRNGPIPSWHLRVSKICPWGQKGIIMKNRNTGTTRDFEEQVKERMREIIKAHRYTDAKAAKILDISPSALCRRIQKDGDTKLTLDFIVQFASNFCRGDIAGLLTGEKYDDFDLTAVFAGLPKYYQQRLIDRMVLEAEDFRELLKPIPGIPKKVAGG